MKKIVLSMAFCFAASIGIAQNHHVISQSQARMLETQMGAVTAPIIAELDEVSSKKIVDTTRFSIGYIKDANTVVALLPEYKQYAVAKYCQKNGYDVIINALFQITTNKSGDELLVVVTGFPARYKRFRPATKEDSWMLPFSGHNSNNSVQILNAK